MAAKRGKIHNIRKNNIHVGLWNEGKMGDDLVYIRWAGEYETFQQLQCDHNDLLETELCS